MIQDTGAYLEINALMDKQIETWELEKSKNKQQEKSGWSSRYRELEYRIRGLKEFQEAIQIQFIHPFTDVFHPANTEVVVKLDELDMDLIYKLRANPHIKNKDLARMVERPASTVSHRVMRLKRYELI